MKLFYLFIAALLTTSVASAQSAWKLKLDKKVLLEATEENMEKNKVALTAAELRKSKLFTLNYGAAGEDAQWQRTITIYDPQDQEMKKFTGRSMSLSASALRKLLSQSSTLHIYTMAIPKDPNLAATVRVRRVHLATVQLK
jgi:hypothetical protein